MNKEKKSILQPDMALAGERIKVLQDFRQSFSPAAGMLEDRFGDKPVQTSEFAFSDTLDEVKEKEVRPNTSGKDSQSD